MWKAGDRRKRLGNTRDIGKQLHMPSVCGSHTVHGGRMFTSSDEVLGFIKNEGIEFIDVRFTDLPGQQQHFNVPAATLPDDFFTDGAMFDGSSIRGFAAIHKSDMKLIPDPSTAFVDPFRAAKTLNVAFS